MVETPEEDFEYLFPREGGKFFLVVGPRGSGKTTLGIAIADRALREHKGYAVASNIVLKTRTDCPTHREQAAERCKYCWQPARMPGYNLITTMVEFFQLVSDLLEADKTTMLVLDEAVLTTGFQAGTSVISQDVRSVLGLVTLLRKFRANLVLIVLDEEATMTKYRKPGPILTGIFRRGRRVSGYDAKEVAELQGPLGSILVRVHPTGFAKPSPAADVGDTIFATTSSASLDMGKLLGKPFNLMGCLLAASNCYDWEVPDRIREYLKTGGSSGFSPPEVKSSEVQRGDDETEPGRQRSTKKGMKAIVDLRIRNGEKPADIAAALGVSKSYAHNRRRIIALESEMDHMLAQGTDAKVVAKTLNVPTTDVRARQKSREPVG